MRLFIYFFLDEHTIYIYMYLHDQVTYCIYIYMGILELKPLACHNCQCPLDLSQ